MSDVPCIRLAHLSEAQKRAYVIADNKLALNAGWDEKMLALELQDLQGMDFDLSLTGFLGNEIDELLAELLRQLRGERARERVGSAARRKRRHETHRPGRPGLPERGERDDEGRERQRARE